MNYKKQGEKKWFVIEGNIGSGKSTFLSLLRTQLQVPVLPEPVDRWQHIEGKYNLLEQFYQDMPRWAYTFQSYAFISRIAEHEKHIQEIQVPYSFVERSVFSDRHCFAKNCFEMGNMTSLEWHLYREWFSWLVGSFSFKPAGFIYLQTDPEICYKRLQKRNRSAESSVSLEYLISLHNKHEQWLIEKQDVDPLIAQVPVLILSCNADFESDKNQQEMHLESIKNFLKEQKENESNSGIVGYPKEIVVNSQNCL